MKQQLVQLIADLEKSQWYTPAELQQLQETQLAILVKYLAKHNSVFDARLARQGLTPNSVSSLSGLTRLRPFTKADIQAAGSRFETPVIPPDHQPRAYAQTSGSTGQPVSMAKTQLSDLWWHALVIRDHQWYSRDYSGRLTSIRAAMKQYLEVPAWGGPVSLLYGSGPAQAIPANMDIDQQLSRVNKFQPNILIVHAGILTAFVSEWEQSGLSLTELKHIKNIGDTVHPELRQRVKNITGLDIEDLYSSSEVGTIAVQCPESGLYHVMSENLIVEILNEQDQPCGQGEIGRVVVTDLYNLASPVVRYDMGDWAEPGPPCSCGRHLPTLRQILGRERGLLKRPDGTRFWPKVSQGRLSEEFGVLQWQIVQHQLDDIEYRVATAESLTTDQIAAIAQIVNDRLGFPGTVRVTNYLRHIPLKNGKYEESVCLI